MGKHYCYRHIRPDKDEPFYIGYGTKSDQNHIIHTGEYKRAFTFDSHHRTSFWRKIFLKNKGQIIVEIIYESDDLNEIKAKEVEFIKLYGRSNIGKGPLCNLTDGGDGTEGHKHTEEFKKSVSERNRSRVWTEEEKLKSSLIRRGIPTGRPMPEHQKEILSKINKGKPRSEDYRNKISNGLKKWFSNNPNPHAKPVIQLSIKGEFIKEWISIAQAQRELRVSNIHAVLTKTQHTAGGFKWVFKKDYKP